MRLNKIMPTVFAYVFLVIAIIGFFLNWEIKYRFFFAGGTLFFLGVRWIIEAIENINIDDK